MAFKLGMTVDLGMAYMLMLVLMTLTLMQGHSGSVKANNNKISVFTIRRQLLHVLLKQDPCGLFVFQCKVRQHRYLLVQST